ncbi:MAG: hypothetical protein ACLSVG_11175 [Clostridia bacterium]
MDYPIPYNGQIKNAGFLYVTGGYHSIPNGCTPWGISENRRQRFIGDLMGTLRIGYEDGTTDEIPLIFGYTLWFQSVWKEGCLPFQTENADPELVRCLQEALYLKGAYEGEESCLLRIRIRAGKTLRSVAVVANPEKEGTPVFRNFTTEGNAADPFWGSHTIDPADPYPQKVRKNIDRINSALLTFETDFTVPPVFQEALRDLRIRFTGKNLADIANGIVFHNLKNMTERIDADGFFHTSYLGAPSWRYDGFGPWVPEANSYYDKFYSRDAGRALMTVNAFGENEKARRSLTLANRLMLYFPEHALQIRGKKIPGHYTVVLNEPLLYSQVLRYRGWPTQYTEERFGAECGNLGNQETDGHGLMMMANYCVWESAADKDRFFQENRESILEGAAWILWCLRNPDVSFSEKGLLYAESEGGMNQFTLYCNLPCCLGLFGYSKMAAHHGMEKEAAEWKLAAEHMSAAIRTELSNGRGSWKIEQVGFQHDPTAVMLSDVCGYDLRDLPEEWRRLSAAT